MPLTIGPCKLAPQKRGEYGVREAEHVRDVRPHGRSPVPRRRGRLNSCPSVLPCHSRHLTISRRNPIVEPESWPWWLHKLEEFWQAKNKSTPEEIKGLEQKS